MATLATPYPVTSIPFHSSNVDSLNSCSATSSSQKFPPTPPLSDDENDLSALKRVSFRPKVSAQPSLLVERKMGETELSYFLPSRADGVNDMYLHLGFRAPGSLITPARIRAAWAYLQLLHPPLASKVRMSPWDYNSARFVYAIPRSVEEALVRANETLEFFEKSGKELIDAYLNGPRTLGEDRIAMLMLGNIPQDGRDAIPTPASTPSPETGRKEAFPPFEDVREFDLLICATHYVGDGMALHTFANEFFNLIAGKNELGKERSTEEIEEMLEREWQTRFGQKLPTKNVLPRPLEDVLPQVEGKFRNAAAKIDLKNTLKKDIGGHAFPRKKGAMRHTIVPTVPIDPKKTKAILKKCKENGVSIANVMFSLSALVWSRMKAEEADAKRELPLMMYLALNMRPYLLASAMDNQSYWFTAIGYLNVILPSFLLTSGSGNGTSVDMLRKTLWHRARLTKKQITKVAKHPLIISRTHEMSHFRGIRARTWAREDDEKDAGIWVAPKPAPAVSSVTVAEKDEKEKKPWVLPPAPSTALVGLSMLGNLDAMYQHANFPALELHTLTTGSRQRAGAMLLFGYTFAGRLWLSLGYDENGFEGDVVERWWKGILDGVDEFLLN